MASSDQSVPTKWYHLEPKDMFAISIALAAFILSCITAYKQLVLAPDLAFFATNLGVANKQPQIDLAVSNGGNAPGTVISVAFYPKTTGQATCGKPPGTNWKTFEYEGKVEPTKAVVYPVKAGESVVRRVSFELSKELSADMDNSPIDANMGGMASREFCIEIGTLDTKNCPVWAIMDLGKMWFYPKGEWSGWSDLSDHLPVKGKPPKTPNDLYCKE